MNYTSNTFVPPSPPVSVLTLNMFYIRDVLSYIVKLRAFANLNNGKKSV